MEEYKKIKTVNRLSETTQDIYILKMKLAN